MKIGFDAKRAYHNPTGLGHYSRTLIRSLAKFFPEHEYFLFNPKASNTFNLNAPHIHEVLPTSIVDKLFSAGWRSSRVTNDLKKLNIDLYHGLSHEIPMGIQRTSVRSVVTMHDLIHERYPSQYNPIDVKIYRKKFQYACTHADKVIAISEQTRKDLIEFYKVPGEKIAVCYQSCNPAFGEPVSHEDKERICSHYGLPKKFFLYVGSIIERKNLLNICKAVFLLRYELDIPLVVIGEGGKYKQQVKDFIRQHGLGQKIIFLSDSPAAKNSQGFRSAADFPAIYQSAIAMIYPSFFEGFGIPVLEALWSKLPVITSNVSSLTEAGGDAVYYVDPHHADEIAHGMRKIYEDHAFADGMREKGWQYANNFTQEKCAAGVMEVYLSLIMKNELQVEKEVNK